MKTWLGGSDTSLWPLRAMLEGNYKELLGSFHNLSL